MTDHRRESAPAVRSRGAGGVTGRDAVPAADSSTLRITRFTSVSPATITKRIELNNDGELVKTTPPQMSRGRADVLSLGNLDAFANVLRSLSPAQALCYGIPKVSGTEFEVFSQQTLPTERTSNQITRTKDDLRWSDGAGVLMLDYDPQEGRPPLDRDTLLAYLTFAVPALGKTSCVWFPSASSCIWNGTRELSGIKGQRLYLVVADGTDIERAGRVLVDRLWLVGLGRYAVSKSGALLPRTLIDASVFQPNRLDFAAGADCVPPLEQRRGDPLVIKREVDFLDTREALPDLNDAELEALGAARQAAEAAVSAEAESARRAYAVALTSKLAAGDFDRVHAARVTAEDAVMRLRLRGDFLLTLDDGTTLTVAEILDDREKYHGRLTADPLEPDYDGGRVVGKLYLMGGRPTLHSFAHGGRTFAMIRAPRRQEVVPGRTSDAIDRTLDALRTTPHVFDRGDVLVSVEGGRAVPLNRAVLPYHLGHELQFFVSTDKGEKDIDPPPKIVEAIVDMGAARRLRPLDAVITAPTIRPDGSVLDRPGYDSRTRLYYAAAETAPPIPNRPTDEQLNAAIDRLKLPFNLFPFADALDRSVLLAAVLTAALRPALPTAPGFAFDAPTQGSGKTLLARCVAIIGCEFEPGIWPHVSQTRDAEAEIRKRLITALLKGDPIIWDNVLGQLDSASIASMLTSPTFTDRVLGLTRDATVPTRSLFIVTGNNLQLAGDMPRRFLTCRVDPQTDRPFARRFALDPARHCLENRQQLVADALTIIRAWLTSADCVLGFRADGATASFEHWDFLVRQCVAWLARRHPGVWVDPIESISAAVASDPEREQLQALLNALHREFGDRAFTAGEVKGKCFVAVSHDENSLSAVIEDIAGKPNVSSKSLGRFLLNRKDRRAGGLRLVARTPDASNVRRWAIEKD